MPKGEIGWKRTTPDGQTIHVRVHRVGQRWEFYWRTARFERWQPLKNPPLEDWLALLDAVRRLIVRRRLAPEDERFVVRRIRELFPDHELDLR